MLIDGVASSLKGNPGLASSPGRLSVPVGKMHFKVEVRKTVIAFAVGPKADVGQRLSSFGKKGATLASDAGFAERRKAARKESLAFYYIDFQSLAAIDPGIATAVSKVGRLASVADITAKPETAGADLRVEVEGAATLFGTAAAMAAYGLRGYQTSARTIEAKSTVSAIARGAVAAWERELPNARTVTHKLCGSTPPVPTEIPKGTTYEPSAERGKDFLTGDNSTGWRCLRFEMTSPLRYRYLYRAGSGYKGPARGGPDPGPKGFEVSAEGDIDGDGKTSLFTVTGKPGKNGSIELSKLFVVDETE
jgi:hypothetical protein